ncbi:uncharacterized protein EI90DRAFT_804105 [Cantharellus anzutake]|uniref:uncharacterized protein n=1 Tax=Cantharellus anzutake TaxID=1750568 RepID=UPI00190600EF|nr:uncharacterized protein EI90DRAFT_804105 [Cantharellus anzutake]KAF8342908.1 hypothetical protein EI90DRAFT_804105 [Cantharellus anzutake]
MHRTGSTIRSSNAVHATPRRTNAQESSANVASGTTEAGTVTTSSKSTSQHGSFKYLAAAAFGHAHSPRVSIDGSAVTSLSRHSSENKGIRPRSRLDSAKSAVRSNLDTLGHSRKNSNQAVIEAISGVSLSASADGQTFWSEPTFAEIVDIRRHTGAFGPPEESIGVALSTPPVTPEGARSSSPSLPNTSSSIIRAGPHPSSPVLAGRFPGHSDIASRHRLPPQVHAHKRSISTGKASFPFPVSPKSEAPSMLDSTPTSMSSHPFAGSNSETGDRPSSHLVQESFEREMMEANRSPWVERTADVGAELQQLSSQLLKDGPRHPTAGPSSSIPSRHLGQRQFAREGGARRSISVQEILSPLERTIRHERSRSLSVSTPPMGGHSDIESSFGSALPELIIGGTDDLEEFRDLFYRPDSEVHPSPNALSHRPDSPIHLDVTTEWIQASFKAESGEGDDQTNRDHHSVLDHQEKVSDSGSMYMGEVGTSLPNIQDSIQRHSSTPVIEQPKSFPELVFTSNNDQDDQLEPTNIPVSIFRPDSLSLPPLAGYVSSGSDDGGLEFHPRERVSHIIRDFPTPPDVTPVAATILSSYFAEPLSGAPSSPAHSSHPDLKHYDIS